MSVEQFIMTSVYVLAGILGVCVGSFLNVVIYRLPNGMSLSKPASHCTTCDYTLKWYDNIPILSYIFLGGKCRKCKQRISPRYMLVELLNGLLWLLSVYCFWEKSPFYAAATAIVASSLICVFFIDLEHMLIFDRFHLIIAAMGIVAMICDPATRWYEHLYGSLITGGFFLIIYFVALAVLKKEGIGFGDVKLAFSVGFFLGWERFLFALVIASVSASIILVIVRRARHDEAGKEYPFGPFIAVGSLASMYFGAPLIDWYVGLLFSAF